MSSSFAGTARPLELTSFDLLRMASEALFAMQMLQLVSVVKMRDVARATQVPGSLKATLPTSVLVAHTTLAAGLLYARIASGLFPLAEWAAHYEKLNTMAAQASRSSGGGTPPTALDMAVHMLANVPATFEGLMLVFDAVSWLTLAVLLGRSIFTSRSQEEPAAEVAAAAEVDKRPKWLSTAPLFLSSLLLASWVGVVLSNAGVTVMDLSLTKESLIPVVKLFAEQMQRHIGIAGLLSTIVWAAQPVKRALVDGTGHAIWLALLAKATVLIGMWLQGDLDAVLVSPPTTFAAAMTDNVFLTLVDVALLVTFFLPFYMPRNIIRVAILGLFPALVVAVCMEPALVTNVLTSITLETVNANAMRSLTMVTLAIAVMSNVLGGTVAVGLTFSAVSLLSSLLL